MTPSPLPDVLCGLTQVEEMLIARAVPIMHIYIKPGGQRGYSGHTVNLPQDIGQLALLLPRYPKDLSIIILLSKPKEKVVLLETFQSEDKWCLMHFTGSLKIIHNIQMYK